MRIGLNFRFRPTFIQKRLLSANEAAIALRPFYFAVHPDRFAREPDLQTSNEKALQVFNGYLNNLFPSNHDNQPPVQIEFAVKDKDNNLKQIRLFLSGFDADHIVRLTLEKCNLSTENLPRGGQKNDKAYLSNFRQWKTEGLDEIWQNLQENERIRRKQYSVDHLFKGIANIRELAIQRMENHKRMAEIIKDLIEGIQRKTGVTQILWSINWELSFMRRCLINVTAMLSHAEKDSRENIVNALNGRRLSFGRGSFLCCDGSLQFGADDAEGAWQKICLESTVRRFDLRNLELLVGRVQDLLGGVQLIVKPLGNILLTIQHMQIFIGRVCSQPATEKSKLRSLLINTNQQVEIVNNYCELTILDGCLQIPCNVDFNSLKHFIAANNATIADQQRREYYAQKCLLESAKEESAKYLNLLSLTWDGNLSFPLVLHCLRKLGQIDPNQVANFSNLEIHISSSQKIVVFSNGKISIPLEWIEKL